MLCTDDLNNTKILFEFVDIGNKLEFETHLSPSQIVNDEDESIINCSIFNQKPLKC
jgi:hypothetical protein